jgi:hypothetical protein
MYDPPMSESAFKELAPMGLRPETSVFGGEFRHCCEGLIRREASDAGFY